MDLKFNYLALGTLKTASQPIFCHLPSRIAPVWISDHLNKSAKNILIVQVQQIWHPKDSNPVLFMRGYSIVYLFRNSVRHCQLLSRLRIEIQKMQNLYATNSHFRKSISLLPW